MHLRISHTTFKLDTLNLLWSFTSDAQPQVTVLGWCSAKPWRYRRYRRCNLTANTAMSLLTLKQSWGTVRSLNGHTKSRRTPSW